MLDGSLAQRDQLGSKLGNQLVQSHVHVAHGTGREVTTLVAGAAIVDQGPERSDAVDIVKDRLESGVSQLHLLELGPEQVVGDELHVRLYHVKLHAAEKLIILNLGVGIASLDHLHSEGNLSQGAHGKSLLEDLDVLALIDGLALAFDRGKSLGFADVLEGVRQFLALLSPLDQLEEVTSRLQKHHCVVTFVRLNRRDCHEDLSEARIGLVASTTTLAAGLVKSVHHRVGDLGLETSQQVMHDWKLIKDTLRNLVLQLTELLSDVGTNDVLHKALGEKGRQL